MVFTRQGYCGLSGSPYTGEEVMSENELTETAEAIESAAGVVERGVEAVAAQIAELAATYGEPAWETVLLITQIDAARSLGVSAVFWCTGIGILWLCIMPKGHFWRGINEQAAATIIQQRAEYLSEEYRQARHADAMGFARSFVSGALSIASAVAVMASTGSLFNVWKWVALFSPELYLAKRALDAVVSL